MKQSRRAWVGLGGLLLAGLASCSSKKEPDGPRSVTDRDGKVLFQYALVDGYLDGAWTARYDTGELREQGSYAKGLATGRWTYFHSNGGPKAEGAYCAGNICGNWAFWDRRGTKRAEGAFQGTGSMDRVGIWREWTESGAFALETCFDPERGGDNEMSGGGTQRTDGTRQGYLYSLGWAANRPLQLRFDYDAVMEPRDPAIEALLEAHADWTTW